MWGLGKRTSNMGQGESLGQMGLTIKASFGVGRNQGWESFPGRTEIDLPASFYTT
jgi:hypothetical protein